ncbi:YqcI/YcgG family protein [uncultured Tateyamaria sp.]|uniref:YqcI/YcgG family protein n=1 Tax=uncultured Tateyamaria sp. TaxID=455651 RepID=UPI0026200C4C|nr:YqcI/YcgG family protein [uncultured Tateyamaria sp.]
MTTIANDLLSTEQRVTTSVTVLQSQPYVAATAQGWHREAYNDVSERLANENGFPCVFSKNAIRKGLLKFIFVEGNGLQDMKRLARGLMAFVEVSSDWNGDLNTAYPLVVAFSENAISARRVEEYHAFGWRTLQRLHSLDNQPWPKEVPYDPSSTAWSMCFSGMPIFCNMSNPAHQSRASRNLGKHFKLVINPRERFDKVAGDTPAGRRARANIRDRILTYDGQPHCPQLGSYGEDSLEWWQYSLSDKNEIRTDRCPFKSDQSLSTTQNCPHAGDHSASERAGEKGTETT